MQTVALPNQPASYTWFDANPEYQNAYRNEPTPVPLLNSLPKSNISSNPGGSTVIQTETPTKHQGGFLGKVENLAHRAGEHLGFGTNTATRWSLYQIPEPLFGEFPAKVVNGTQGYVGGFLFVSQNHLCYSSYTDKLNRAIKVAIPFANIQHIGLAQKVKGTSGAAVVLTPLTALSQRPNALQVVTRDNVNHQFFGFKKNTESVFNLLNHSWQTSRGIAAPQQLSGQYGLAGQQQVSGQYGTQGISQQQFSGAGLNNTSTGQYNTNAGAYGNPLDTNHDGRVDARDLQGQQHSGQYSTNGLVNSFQSGGLVGSDQYVNATTSTNPSVQQDAFLKQEAALHSQPTATQPL